MKQIKFLLFWLLFWLFYAVALVIGIVVIIAFYAILAPIALFEFLKYLTKDRKKQ